MFSLIQHHKHKLGLNHHTAVVIHLETLTVFTLFPVKAELILAAYKLQPQYFSSFPPQQCGFVVPLQ